MIQFLRRLFASRQTLAPVVDAEVYALFLQSRCGELDWFLGLEPAMQRQLAEQGATERALHLIDMARCLADPELFEAQTFPDEKGADDVILDRQVARGVAMAKETLASRASQIAPAAPSAPSPNRLTGALDRAAASSQERQEIVDHAAVFMGRRATPREPVPRETSEASE